MPGTGTLISVLTAELLRERLKLASAVLLAAVAGFGVLDLLAYTPAPIVSVLLAAAIPAAAAGLLWSRVALSLGQLRIIELSLFGSVALAAAVRCYSLMEMHLTDGSADLAASALSGSAWQAALLVTAYGVLIPNNWRRGLAVTAGLAIVPMAAWLLFQSRPDAAGAIGVPHIAELVLLLGASVVISLLATTIVQRYRSDQVEAAEIGFYTLIDRIGAGGMGEVWLAEHSKLVRPAAIKLIRPEVLEDVSTDEARRIVRRFEREAQATAALRSAHTIELYDFGVAESGVFYYVMEYLEGIDLARLVKQFGPLPPARAVHLLRQVCESLAEAHEKHLVHRDIKPSNVLTCRLGTVCDFVKVLDFGLVKTQAGAHGDSELSVEGATSGTPAFMPPELAVGSSNFDGRADLYAVGCLAYWLLTGRLVFESETPLAMIVDHVKAVPEPPSASVAEVGTDLDRLVLKCLEKDPADRFQSASQLDEALSACNVGQWSRRDASLWWEQYAPSPAPPSADTQQASAVTQEA